MRNRGHLRQLAGLLTPKTSVQEAKNLAKEQGLRGRTGGAHGLDIFKISVETLGQELSQEYNKLGFVNSAKEAAGKLSRIEARILNVLSKDALAAIKSAAPVHYYKGTKPAVLRDHHIHDTGAGRGQQFRAGSSRKMSRDIYVDNKAHIVPYRSGSFPASSLADYKNTVQERRSGKSIAEKGYSSLSGSSYNWIGQAQANFRERVPKLINEVVNSSKSKQFL